MVALERYSMNLFSVSDRPTATELPWQPSIACPANGPFHNKYLHEMKMDLTCMHIQSDFALS
ncbi:hypothetical protein Mapa_013123 [Marchantia paleacea]|nr:hypothetical protein Mapa_013123 [Marchantia paleacea]